MPEIPTCGRSKIFLYTGDINNGVTLHFNSVNVQISAELFTAILNEFNGTVIPGGFNMTDPLPGGLGMWLHSNSAQYNNDTLLTPRHASFIAAILNHEGYINCYREGNAVYLDFPAS